MSDDTLLLFKEPRPDSQDKIGTGLPGSGLPVSDSTAPQAPEATVPPQETKRGKRRPEVDTQDPCDPHRRQAITVPPGARIQLIGVQTQREAAWRAELAAQEALAAQQALATTLASPTELEQPQAKRPAEPSVKARPRPFRSRRAELVWTALLCVLGATLLFLWLYPDRAKPGGATASVPSPAERPQPPAAPGSSRPQESNGRDVAIGSPPVKSTTSAPTLTEPEPDLPPDSSPKISNPLAHPPQLGRQRIPPSDHQPVAETPAPPAESTATAPATATPAANASSPAGSPRYAPFL